MKCPLLSAGEYTRNVLFPTSACNCIEEKCAWWFSVEEDKTTIKGCAITVFTELIHSCIQRTK